MIKSLRNDMVKKACLRSISVNFENYKLLDYDTYKLNVQNHCN